MSRTPNSKKINKALSKQNVRFAYLFGSRASGPVTASSDHDIAIFFGTGTPATRFEKRLRLTRDLEEIFHTIVDVVVLDDVRSVSLRYSVISEGKCIYIKDDGARVDFEFRSAHEYEDFAPFLKAYNEMYIGSI